jgi:hypothetical protein
MPRKAKKLKIENHINSTTENRIHFDEVDSLYAEEHYGYYLMTISTRSSEKYNLRYYLSYSHKIDYYRKKRDNNRDLQEKIEDSLFEETDYLDFIRSCIHELFQDRKSRSITSFIIKGLILFIEFLKKERISVKNVFDIETKHHKQFYFELSTKDNIAKHAIRQVDRFFGEVLKVNRNLNRVVSAYQIVDTTKKPIPALPSTIIYQLSKYSNDEFLTIQEKVSRKKLWIKNKDKILSLKNLLFTLIEETRNSTMMYDRKFKEIIEIKLNVDYNIDVRDLFITKIDFNKFSEKDKTNHNKRLDALKALASCGINISAKTEENCFLWSLELLVNHPYSNEICEKYYKYFQGSFSNVRKWLGRRFDISLNTVDNGVYPTATDLYPLYLLLLIEFGINQEALKDWKVIKDIDKSFILKGDNLGLVTIIDCVKEKTNTSISVVIKNDSLVKKYLDFYINWCSPIYEITKSNELFQYLSMEFYNKYCSIKKNPDYLRSAMASPSSLYLKYEILDQDNCRIKSIDHRSIRKSHNYQDFLNAKKLFERQVRKQHKSANTTVLCYEDMNIEWNEIKRHKIAVAQERIVGFFEGEIDRNDKLLEIVFNGPLSDCKDNKNPTFDNAPELKKDEYCCDWTKCLTLCDKSFVIPQVHGPVIYAWIDFMENQKEDFFKEEDWAKEYLIDYESANNTIMFFTEEEKDYCKKELFKHTEFVSMKFQKIIKIKKDYCEL